MVCLATVLTGKRTGFRAKEPGGPGALHCRLTLSAGGSCSPLRGTALGHQFPLPKWTARSLDGLNLGAWRVSSAPDSGPSLLPCPPPEFLSWCQPRVKVLGNNVQNCSIHVELFCSCTVKISELIFFLRSQNRHCGPGKST